MATILVVDDRPSNRELAVTLLRYHGHRLIEAADGAQALAIADDESPDLVIADILMPAMDGFEFVRRFRSSPATHKIPVIFWTAHYRVEEVQCLAERLGVSHLLSKTSGPEELLRIVDDALGSKPALRNQHPAAEFDGHHLRLLTDVYFERSNDVDEHMSELQREISVRKRAEEALRASEQRLRDVVVSSPAVLFTLSVENSEIKSVSWISENLLELLGYSTEASRDPSWWPRGVYPDDLDRVAAKTNRELFTKDRVTDEYRFLHANGSYRWIHSEMRLRRDGHGNPLEVVGSWLDINEQKSLEEQLRQSQKMDAIGRLAGGVAHDFNNLLTIINGYGEMVYGMVRAGDPLRDIIDEVRQAGERAAALTRQLLAFSRKQVLVPEVQDLNELLKEMDKMLRRLIGEDIDLELSLANDLGRIKVDPSQIEQVIMNLVVNARDAMPRGGKLTIETKNVDCAVNACCESCPEIPAGNYVALSVRDTGSGMDEATRLRIFEPFFSTKGEKGTGLGLATVYGIVKQSGGGIQVDCEVGAGACFRIYLPREKEGGIVRSRPSELAPSVTGSETILLVEDEKGVRTFAKRILQRCGYTVIEAQNGGEAAVLCEQHQGIIQLMISDVVMPNMSGKQLADLLAPMRPDMKVLFMSGYTDEALSRHFVIDSGLPILQKPFKADALTRKVREVLDRRG